MQTLILLVLCATAISGSPIGNTPNADFPGAAIKLDELHSIMRAAADDIVALTKAEDKFTAIVVKGFLDSGMLSANLIFNYLEAQLETETLTYDDATKRIFNVGSISAIAIASIQPFISVLTPETQAEINRIAGVATEEGFVKASEFLALVK